MSIILNDFEKPKHSLDRWNDMFRDEEEACSIFDAWKEKDFESVYGIIRKYKEPTQEEIREKKDEINWHSICRWIKLDKDFIREMRDYIDWNVIELYQKPSPDFIKEMRNRK